MNELSSTWEQYLTNTDAPISAIDFGTGLILTVIAAYAVKLVYTSHGQSLSNRRAFGNLFRSLPKAFKRLEALLNAPKDCRECRTKLL